jgi:DNA-binding IclR family transcriptional regulator
MAEQRVEAVERALALLECFSDGSESLSLAQLAERTDMYRSTILRLAGSLQRNGYLTRSADGQFRLGATLWRLGSLYERSFKLADYVRPVLADVAGQVDETAAYYIREGEHRICLYRHEPRQSLRHHQDEGAELPLDRGAGGHILTAYTTGTGEFYENVRAAGFYISMGERNPEAAAVAVPVFGVQHQFMGALGVIAALSRTDQGRAEEIRDILLERAAALSTALSGTSNHRGAPSAAAR